MNRSRPQYLVSVDTVVPPAYVAGSRRQEELTAVEDLLSRTTPSQRDKMRAALARQGVELVGARDAESARLMGVIATIRYWDRVAEQENSVRSRVAVPAERILRVRVTMALVSDMDLGTIATIVRHPDDGGKPLLLLNGATATSETVSVGLDAAAAAGVKYGTNPEREVRLDLRGRPTRTQPAGRPGGEMLLQSLRSARTKSIRGVGETRAMDVLVERKRDL